MTKTSILQAENEALRRRISELETEQKMRAGGRTLQLLIEYAPAAIAMFDHEMRYLAASRRFISDYQLSEQNLIGFSHYEIFPEIPERWKEIHRRCLAGAVEKAEADPFPRAEGGLDWVRWEIHPWYEEAGSIGGIILFSEVITARQQTEAKLSRLAERLDLALRSARLGIWDWDIQKNEIVWDDQMYVLYGLDPDEFGGAYEAWLHGVHPDDREAGNAISAAAVRGEREYDTEFRVLWPDGSVHWLKATGDVFRAENGMPLRMVGVNYDITERKKADELITDLARMPAENPNPVLRVSLDGNILYANPASKVLLDFWKTPVGQSAPPAWLEIVAKVRQTNQLCEVEQAAADRSYVFDFAPALESGYINVYGKDVTERRLAEESLRESEARFRAFIESAPLAVSLGRNGKLIYANPMYVKMYGFESADEVIGRPTQERVAPRSREKSLAFASDRAEGRLTDQQYELIGLRKDGTEFPMLASVSRLELADGPANIGFFQDITERKQAEESLAYQANLLVNVHDAIVGTDTELRVTYWNKAAEGIFGWSAAETLGRSTTGLFKTLFQDTTREQMLQEMLAKGQYDGELRYVRKNGEYFDAQARSVVLKDDLGQFTGLVSLIRDITERKQAEEKLRERDELLSVMGSSAQVGGWDLDIASGVGHWTEEVARIHDLDPATQPNKEMGFTFYSGKSREQIEAAVQAAIEQGIPYDLELEIVSATGAHKWIRTIGHPVLEHEQVVKLRGSFQDITKRKLAEDALRESEQRYSILFEKSAVPVVLVKLPEVVIVDTNEACENLVEYPRQEMRGKTAGELGLARAEERARLIADFEKYGVLADDEIPILTRSGVEKIVIANTNPLELGGQPYAMTTLQDITARKQAEAELHRILDELKRSNAELEQFAYVASHDLQEPLRTVVGMVQLLQQRYQGQLDARADEYIHFAVDASARMQTLISDLLEFSRVGRRGRPFEPTDMDRVLHVALANLHTAIAESQAQITSEPLPVVQVDAGQLTQVIQNLLSNAIKFRSEQPLQIHISAEKIENAWQFAVQDNGIGIDPQYFERIFMIFQRLHTRSKYPGTGIGLALCKKIIERHGGQIWIQSEPEQGATFFFTIPERSA